MKFGFDIDDTLINLREHAFHLYNQKLQMNVDLTVFRQLKRLEIHELFQLDDASGYKMWDSLQEEIYFSDCPVFEGAKELINYLHSEGHTVVYITSRPKKFCKQTREWLKVRGFPVIDQYFFCGMKDHEKVEIIRSLQLDYYFDDKPAVLETLKDAKTKVYVKHQSYNEGVTFDRIDHWNEFLNRLKMMRKPI